MCQQRQRGGGRVFGAALLAAVFLFAPHVAPLARELSGGKVPHLAGLLPKLTVPRLPSAGPALGSHRITTTRAYGCDPARDLRSAELDQRVTDLLEWISGRWSVRVSCVHTGHSRFVKGTARISNHYRWRAVDLDKVGGRSVGPSNRQAKALAGWLNGLAGRLEPSEIGSPWLLPGGARSFTDEGHQGHLHIGYGAG